MHLVQCKAFVPIPLPAGYKVSEIELLPDRVFIKWLVPGGGPVYAAVVIDRAALKTDLFWVDLLARVQAYVANHECKPVQSAPNIAIFRTSRNTAQMEPIFDSMVKNGVYEVILPSR